MRTPCGRVVACCAGRLALSRSCRSLAPQFWVTLGNYIGLYSIVALGLVLLTGVGGTDVVRAGGVRRPRRLHDGLPHDALRHVAVAHAAIGLAASPARVALFLGFITLRMTGHYLPLATIAWGISLFYLFGNLELLGGHTGMTGIPALSICSASSSRRAALSST